MYRCNKTSVHTKSTNLGDCINYHSDCPLKYKTGVILTFLNRAHKICSTWHHFNNEVQRIKQLLVNNNFPNKLIDNLILKFLNKKYDNNNSSQMQGTTLKLYYENQWHTNYKQDEKVLKNVFQQHVKCVNPNDRLSLNIFYKNRKISNLIMKNNLHPNTDPLKKSHVVYCIKCPGECDLPNPTYIGYTTNQLQTRLSQHLREGAPKQHMFEAHNSQYSKDSIANNTDIIVSMPDANKLSIYEALCILRQNPDINKQLNTFTRQLKLYTVQPSNEVIQDPRPQPGTASQIDHEISISNNNASNTNHNYNLRPRLQYNSYSS